MTMQPKPKKTRSQKNVRWIEKYCVIPRGPRKGSPVRLDTDQRELLATIYDADTLRSLPIIGELAAYLVLLHTVGIESPMGDKEDELPEIAVDRFTLWAAAGPKLQDFIERDGAGAIVCRGLGTRWPRHRAA
ncbi:hypothetical protein [Bradyrhizobium sp. McL0615]|uniref:hypothetical protein n=1 Tax=Bradyrhizobium sp. McL0615 TaxID=3415673 RepID=UPI003CE8C614